MIDINSTDFIEKFDMKAATVGIIGHGFVGKAVEAFFKDSPCKILIYDKAQKLDTLEDVVKNAELIFVCVPTPMKTDGSCYTGIVESVIRDIRETAKKVERNLDSFVIVHKSTVTPGFTEELHDKYFGMRILYSPEFLTEKNAIEDFKNCNRIIFGGEQEDARIASKFFEAVKPEWVARDRLLLLQCDNPTTAEMAKLFTNGILMTKVLFCNEIYQMCQKLGVDYDEMRLLALLDRRIGPSHTAVPGHDGSLGAGGHCFPKDINNLRAVCKDLGIPEKIFSAVIDRNNEVRENKDWLEMKGRAVIDE